MAGAGRRGRRAPPPRTTYGATREDATRPRALESFRASESQISTPATKTKRLVVYYYNCHEKWHISHRCYAHQKHQSYAKN
uniref:Uncharacterized protein n=1 Tax=Oryza glumipatula TaxID=40148 RepID=A0A0E0ACU7_9ORYZ